MKERGQSTIEAAIALPAAVFLVWWAVAVPAAGLRSVAARVAVLGGARQAAVSDRVEGGEVKGWVMQRWGRLTGGAGAKTVEAQVSGEAVSVTATEDWTPPGAGLRAALRLPRERD
ncbi:MAG: hypothetical protein ACM3RP_02920 [Chitinophagales bacterium]